MRQRLFYPPNVAGWEDDRWLDTGTWRGRWIAVTHAVRERELKTDEPYEPDAPADRGAARDRLLGQARRSRPRHAPRLVAFAERCDRGANTDWKRKAYPILRQNALRVLVATSPDLQAA